MKKIIAITACIIGLIFIITGCLVKMNNNTIGIIGGADGPTSVFVAAKLNSAPVTLLIVIGIVMLIGAIVFFLNRKK